MLIAAIALLAPAAGARPRPRRRPSCPSRRTRASPRRCSSRWTTACKLARDGRASRRADGQTPLPGPVPGRASGMTPYSRNGVCGCFPPDFFATRGMAGAVVDVRGTGGSGGNLEGNFFSPREARDGYAVSSTSARSPSRPARWGWPAARTSGSPSTWPPSSGRRIWRRSRPRSRSATSTARATPTAAIPNSSSTPSTSPSRARPAPAGANTDPCLLERDARRRSSASRRRDDRVRLPRAARTTTPSTATARRSTGPAEIEVPALIIGGWRDGLSARRAGDVPARCRAARASRPASTSTRARTRAAGAPFAPLTNPPGPDDVVRAGLRVPAQAPRGRERRPSARRSSTTSRGGRVRDARPLAAAGDAVRARWRSAPARCAPGRRRRRRAARRATSPIRPPASAWRSTSTARSPRARTCRPTSGSRARTG